VNDSPEIASVLLKRIGEAGIAPAAELEEFSSPSALKWASWSDSKFSVLLFPNITRSFSESYEAFGYVMQARRSQLLGRSPRRAARSLRERCARLRSQRMLLLLPHCDAHRPSRP
jgi:hypothetical protein